MVRPWVWLLGLLLLAPRLWAAPLSVSFPDADLEVGRTVRVVLGLDRPRPSLETLDLAPWSPWLVLERRGERRLDRHGAQTMVVWLTPRVAGDLRLPPLSLDGPQGPIQGTAQGVRIALARDPGDGEAITPRFPALPGQAWLRQQLVYAVSVDSRRPSLRLEAEPAEVDGFLLLPVPPQSQAVGEGPDRYYRHTAGWLIFPTRPGSRRLELPALRYIRDGVGSHRFYPPTLSVEVRPLPVYLPPGVAVGRLEQHGMARPWRIETVGELQSRRFTLITHGVPAAWWRPPGIEATAPGTVRLFESRPRVEQRIDASGLTVRYEYRLPLSPQGWGWQRLQGAARLYGFDPERGTLQSQELEVPLPLALTRWQQALLALLLFGLSWRLGRGWWRRVRALYRRLAGYRAALAVLAGATELSRLQGVLAILAEAEAWPVTPGLGRWGARWRLAHPACPLDDWLSALEAARYGNRPADVTAMAKGLLAVLRRRLGCWRWICEFRLRAVTSR